MHQVNISSFTSFMTSCADSCAKDRRLSRLQCGWSTCNCRDSVLYVGVVGGRSVSLTAVVMVMFNLRRDSKRLSATLDLPE